MVHKDELLNLSEIARLAGVARTAAQKWHKVPRKTGGEPPLLLVVKALEANARDAEALEGGPPDAEAPDSQEVQGEETEGEEAEEGGEHPPLYSREVVVAFLKAVGYMNADESPMERRVGKGKWAPTHPTIDPRRAQQPAPDSGQKPLKVDPRTGGRIRYYLPHAWKLAGFGSENSFSSSKTHGRAPLPDGIDELERPYWFAETLEAWKAGAEERKVERYASRTVPPDGYTSEGQPYRVLPGTNYYARKAARTAGAADQEEPSREG
ncbi:hypothetical protein [Streptomyces sp. NPDC048638]|uniref:hypothetical protein n=1 Tax=Streptomyces sp. NPDC048638 TaxID=3365580 RepID=UPI003719269C